MTIGGAHKFIKVKFLRARGMSGISASSRAVVKQAENFRVRELVKKIECHPHRSATK